MTPFWDHQRLRPAATAHAYRVGNDFVLFDELSQNVFAQNDSSASLWRAICSEGSIVAAARALAPEGHYETVLGYARTAAHEWLRAGLLLPELTASPEETISLCWSDTCVAVHLSGDLDRQALRDVFAPFISDASPTSSIQVTEFGALIFISDAESACARAPHEWVPEVKARLTSRLVESREPGFFAHAALFSRDGAGVLVCGEPGAGKTTLSVSMALAGFAYHSDDVVRIGDDGAMQGAPFAPAIKEGSWPLLQEMEAAIPASAEYLRSDGQTVRYLLLPASSHERVRAETILLVARGADGPPRIEPVAPLEALTTILGSAYSARRAISTPALASLIQSIEKARIGRLCFSDWRDGRRLIDELSR